MDKAGNTTRLTLLTNRRTKIIATVGPACADPQTLRHLIEAGVDVFRLNMSHGEHACHCENYARVRAVASGINKPVAIFADLCGPKIRTGIFTGGSIELITGETVTLTMRDIPGEPGIIPSQYTALADDVQAGHRIFLADGMMELKVNRIENGDVICRVEHGGTLTDHKGINLPDACISAPSMTEKDFRDAEFTTRLGVDFLALSFVRSAKDIMELRNWLKAQHTDTGIIAKIERPEAVRDANAIVAAADAIMVARGDLGVELPPEEVPIAQLALIHTARAQHKPVIVATQILESMIENARPTRAETTDIFHSVSSGSDALMLSGETAVGAHPLACVEMMDRTIRYAEAYLWKVSAFSSTPNEAFVPGNILAFDDAVARATAKLSRDLMVRGIVVLSRSGITAAMISSERPEAPVLAVTTQINVVNNMSLLWGVIPVLAEEKDICDMASLARQLAREHELAASGDAILLVQGFHPKQGKNHPSVTILCV